MQHRSLKDKGVYNPKFFLIDFVPLNNRECTVRTAEPALTPLYCESTNDKSDLAEDSKVGLSVQCDTAGKKDHSGWNTESQTQAATVPLTSTLFEYGPQVLALLPYQQEVGSLDET